MRYFYMARVKRGKARIVVDEKVMVGKPIIEGTRVTVEAIIRRMAEGLTIKELLKEHPQLRADDITAALEYAANVVSEEETTPRVKAYA